MKLDCFFSTISTNVDGKALQTDVIFHISVKPMSAPAPPPPAQTKPALSEDEMDKKSKSIIEEYLHINDLKVCVQICSDNKVCSALLMTFILCSCLGH